LVTVLESLFSEHLTNNSLSKHKTLFKNKIQYTFLENFSHLFIGIFRKQVLNFSGVWAELLFTKRFKRKERWLNGHCHATLNGVRPPLSSVEGGRMASLSL
jgi:hypothetical protein